MAMDVISNGLESFFDGVDKKIVSMKEVQDLTEHFVGDMLVKSLSLLSVNKVRAQLVKDPSSAWPIKTQG